MARKSTQASPVDPMPKAQREKLNRFYRNPLLGDSLRIYVYRHASRITTGDSKVPGNFFVVTQPLKVFKALCGGKVAALLIPVGAVFYWNSAAADLRVDQAQKARVNLAKTIRITSVVTGQEHDRGYSLHQPSFSYVPGEYVFPDKFELSKGESTCAGGIHFFFNLSNALDYMNYRLFNCTQRYEL